MSEQNKVTNIIVDMAQLLLFRNQIAAKRAITSKNRTFS